MSLVNRYICQQCGADHAKWEGRCSTCSAWNSLVEVAVSKRSAAKSKTQSLVVAEHSRIISIRDISAENMPRLSTGFEELDRVLGGGLVPGSVVLVAGEPGVGKSTLLLQAILHTGGLYISAEESAHQIKLRADRVGIGASNTTLLATNSLDLIINQIDSLSPKPPLVIIDSIQTITTDDLEGVPGSIGQVRESAHRLVNLSKRTNIPILIVSHVTKEGTIAGPKALEHVVDVVIYVEGEELSMIRLVRGVKNRFGPVHEVGLFELAEKCMKEIIDSSAILMPDKAKPTSGMVITATMEGIRPMLLEIQALTTITAFGLPRRTANGMDYNRLLMLVAVLSKRTKLNLGNQDIYTNVSGGMKIRETAIDLAICLALVSSILNKPLATDTLVFGEVGLSGEIRPVVGQQKRLDQAKKMGFKNYITPDRVHTLTGAIEKAFPQK